MKRKVLYPVIALAAAVLLFSLAWCLFAPEGVVGEKNIAVTVIHGDGSEKLFRFSTDSENLRGALERQGLISGEEGPYGLFVTGVDGEMADGTVQQWWSVTKDGESLMTGVDDTLIADGDSYEFTLTTGW